MNFNKVRQYTKELIEKEKDYYPAELFPFNIELQGGSFGACLMSIDSPFYSTSCRYVGNYKAIHDLITSSLSHAYNNMTSRYYEKATKGTTERAYYKLQVFNDDLLVNTMESHNREEVKTELLKCFFAKEKRGVKTKIHFVPYSSKIEIVHRWKKEDYHGSYNLTYKYIFEGVEL